VWTGSFTQPNCPLRSALPTPRRAFSSRRRLELRYLWCPVTAQPSPVIRGLLSCDRGCITNTEREVCRRSATQDTFLWRGALLEPFAVSPVGACPAWVQRSSSFCPAEVANPRELGPVRSPQPQPRLASRARRALTRFCNFSTRNPGTPTKDRSSHEPNAFARLACPTKPRGLPSCERYGTETSLFWETPADAPKAPAVPADER
jgi:hypothetical protein